MICICMRCRMKLTSRQRLQSLSKMLEIVSANRLTRRITANLVRIVGFDDLKADALISRQSQASVR